MLRPTNAWDPSVKDLFASPYWISATLRSAVGQQWYGCMMGYQIDLSDYASVRSNSMMIYRALHSRWMPLTTNNAEYWPDEALEKFRGWVNAGWPLHEDSIPEPAERIPPSSARPLPMAVRRDLRSLSPAELDHYRMRFDEAFRVADAAPASPGQRFFSVHGDWCLHYQEAFIFWHRAYLMRFEQTLGCPIPYWNWFAFDASVDGSPNAGLPTAFTERTYVHPQTGETRPNPLRFAAARHGRSAGCAQQDRNEPDDCYYVQRDSLLYTCGDDHRRERAAKISLTRNFQDQVQRALNFSSFSTPEGDAVPWANILTFNPPPSDQEYVYRNQNFDGAYEQPHDNYHGWIGPDMGNNSYTAFDPIFWSYHANIDRIFEMWLRAHPETTATSGFPLHPFAGSQAGRFEFEDPRPYIYTTIGDLARDSRGLGYDYGEPVAPEYDGTTDEIPAARKPGSCPAGQGRIAPLSASPLLDEELLVRFEGVRCTLRSYWIDVFLGQADPAPSDVEAANPHYVGRLSRIGMGQADDKGRCIKSGVARMLDATKTARRLGLRPGDTASLSMIVRELPSGRIMPAEEYQTLPGFVGEVLWFDRGVAIRQTGGTRKGPPSSCCSGN